MQILVDPDSSHVYTCSMDKKASKAPLVSVLIPVYNREKLISYAIESILRQTYINWELIIVNDGSTDATLSVIKKYASRDKRIRIISNPHNLGIAPARNIAARAAQGTYIVWLDSDDTSPEERIEKQVWFMEANPDVGVCGGTVELFQDGRLMETRRYPPDDASLRKKIFMMSPVSQGASIIRKTLLDDAGMYDESLQFHAEDLDLFLRIGRISKFANIPDMVLHCNTTGSISYTNLNDNIRATLKVRKKACTQYGYRMRIADRIAYLVTWAMLLLPSRLVIGMFRVCRKRVSRRVKR